MPWTSERIYDELLRRMLAEELTHETVLLETALSEEFRVSRTPVREAIARLVQLQLLERAQRGFRVSHWSPTQVLDLYQARIALESEAAGLAAERHRPLDLARLEHLAETAAQTSDHDQVRSINAAWHQTLRASCYNEALWDVLEIVGLRLRIGERSATSPHDPAENSQDHQAIIAALRARDTDAARAAMRTHLTRVRDLRTMAIAREE